MAGANPFNLFIYGTLQYPWVFRAVLGKQLTVDAQGADGETAVLAQEAVLPGYKKVSPDGTYLYAVPDPHGRIRGQLVGPLPPQDLKALRRYEGRNYRRKTLTVQTAARSEKAVVFVANLPYLQHPFGYAFQDPLKQEVLLENKIQQALVETEQRQLHTTEPVARRAVAELHGLTIRNLIRRHFDAGGVSDYAIRLSLIREPLRDFSRITGDPAAAAVAPHYLRMVARQVLFNQFEDRIRRELRYELDHLDLGSPSYARTVASLAALQMLNGAAPAVRTVVEHCLGELSFTKDHLVDYVRCAVLSADTLYDSQTARGQTAFIANHIGRGHIPFGTELEFSNVGHAVISDPKRKTVCDPKYDGFIYFRDFALDVLTWKLGGHIDDHRVKSAERPRRGFFETALGNLSIEAGLSEPITDDPWLLNQLIHETRQFFDIAPHSLHISLQLRSPNRPVKDRRLPIEILKCLFALAGDPVQGQDGRWRLGRLAGEEIIGKDLPRGRADAGKPHMLFSEISRRRRVEADETLGVVPPEQRGRYVQQFKFLRLSETINYEPIAMALKGIQISLRPGSFLTAAQLRRHPKHRQLFEELLAWGRQPSPLAPGEVDAFLTAVRAGLMRERRGKPAHTEAYIAWSINQLRTMLKGFNALVAGQVPAKTA